MRNFIIHAVVLWALSFSAQAKIESMEFANEQMEEDYKVLIQELRCLVCQNQNLADSNAELAQDLRRQVVELLDKGSSRDEVVDYMIARYGDFVMYRPPLKITTVLLWFGPVVFFFIAGYVVISFIRKQQQSADVGISEQQKQKAHSLLDDE
ncbi:MAG: cytochrome c-type biogenesis protein CcmH [Gammaproteobacteria bacterium]|nr:cytochrome c-type biogenesis protein CcmH [Gammaproteobacteria bacterium]